MFGLLTLIRMSWVGLGNNTSNIVYIIIMSHSEYTTYCTFACSVNNYQS